MSRHQSRQGDGVEHETAVAKALVIDPRMSESGMNPNLSLTLSVRVSGVVNACEDNPVGKGVVALSAVDLAGRLLVLAEVGRADSYYRLARMVARVLTGSYLKQRRKWCDFARVLAADPGVEERLVRQAMGWLAGGASRVL